MSEPRNMEQLRRDLNHQIRQIRQKQGWERLSESVNHIAGMVFPIAETNGEDWVNHDPFTEEEKVRF